MSERGKAISVLAANTLAFTVCFAVWMMNGVLITFLVDNGVYDFDKAEMGWLIGIPVLTGAIFRLPAGMLTDRFGGRGVFAVVMLLTAAAAYLDKRQARHKTKVTGNFHPFDHINPDQLQCRVPFLSGNKGGVGSEADYSDYGFDAEYGIGGFACMLNTARYVAVAPRNESTSVRSLPFNAGC